MKVGLQLGYYEGGDHVVFWIADQDQRGTQFGRGGASSFTAWNGVRLASSSFPDIKVSPGGDAILVNVRGDHDYKDKKLMGCTRQQFARILCAIDEYNKWYAQRERAPEPPEAGPEPAYYPEP